MRESGKSLTKRRVPTVKYVKRFEARPLLHTQQNRILVSYEVKHGNNVRTIKNRL